MGTLRRVRRDAYRLGRDLGDLEAVASGDPAKVVKRVVRRQVYRQEGRLTRRVLRSLGLSR